MIHLPSLPSGFIVFCDDIRHEMHGKITLVGVYADEITIFGEAPIVLPQLKALVVCRFPPDDFPKTVRLRAIYTRDGQEEIPLFESDLDLGYNEAEAEAAASYEDREEIAGNPDLFTFSEIRTLIALNTIRILGPGLIRIRINVGEDEIRLGALEIKLQPAADKPQIGISSEIDSD